MLANSPWASASTACFTRSAMAWVSEASMVVWFTTPTLCRCFCGSSPGVARPSNRFQKPSTSLRSPSIQDAKNSASSAFFTTKAWPVSAAWENVARVSSWVGLPWMTTVYSLPPNCAERFQTFSTNGHVVLYFCTSMPFATRVCSNSTVAPKAGTITTSSGWRSARGTRGLPIVSCKNLTPRLCKSALTSGLWIIWLNRKIRLPSFSAMAL